MIIEFYEETFLRGGKKHPHISNAWEWQIMQKSILLHGKEIRKASLLKNIRLIFFPSRNLVGKKNSDKSRGWC